MRRALVLLAGLVPVVGCGDDLKAPPDGAVAFLDQLRALPGVIDAAEAPTGTVGFHYYVLHFAQPVDHADPASATFPQEISLLHADVAAPLIVWTTGYGDFQVDYPAELTSFLAGNQISIEHRFYGGSHPAAVDWSKLTIQQMAADEHAIIAAFRTLYTGKVLTSGGSKGGMTAVFHRRFYPDDVDGTVAYVAPINFAIEDGRYPPYLATIGTASCRANIRALAVDLLQNRRAMVEDRARAEGYAYARVALGPAVEAAINDLEWDFWQYHGAPFCGNMPKVTDTDDILWAYLQSVSPPSANSDQSIASFEGYYFQVDNQLGYPDDATAYLDPYRLYGDADYAQLLPTAKPVYDDAAAMHDIDDFVQHAATRMLFIYGAWDPWTGGAYQLGAAADSLLLTVPKGSHNANLRRLSDADRATAFDRLAAWTGVTPQVTAREAPAHPREPHVPSALRHALARRP